MPNPRTTVIAKKKAYTITDGDFIKIGGQWYVVEHNQVGYSSGEKRHLRLTPEGDDSGYECLSFFVSALSKFKVRTST